MDCMQPDKQSQQSRDLAKQTTPSVPETNVTTEANAKQGARSTALQEATRDESLHPSTLAWVEAASTSPGDRPIVLINTSAVNYVEIRSRVAGREHCRVVFTNGSEYVLQDSERAGNFLRQLRNQGIWQAAETANTGEPSVATVGGR
jgi:hypothetical protein